MNVILVILLCIVLLSGVGDFFFNVMKFGVKVFLGIVLLIASVWLIIKMSIIMIPWIFILSIIGALFGIIWLIRTLLNRV